MPIKQAVRLAVDELCKAYPDSEILAREDGDGGVYLILESIHLGERFVPQSSWIGFRITFQYPYADCYPHFVRGDLKHASGQPLAGAGIQPKQTFEGRAAIQLSRRSKRLDPQTDTALLKLQKVLHWLRSLG